MPASPKPMRASGKVRQKLHNFEALLKGAIAVVRRCPAPFGMRVGKPAFEVVSIAEGPLDVRVEGMESIIEAELRAELQQAHLAYQSIERENKVLRERINVLSRDIEDTANHLDLMGRSVKSWLHD